MLNFPRYEAVLLPGRSDLLQLFWHFVLYRYLFNIKKKGKNLTGRSAIPYLPSQWLSTCANCCYFCLIFIVTKVIHLYLVRMGARQGTGLGKGRFKQIRQHFCWAFHWITFDTNSVPSVIQLAFNTSKQKKVVFKKSLNPSRILTLVVVSHCRHELLNSTAAFISTPTPSKRPFKIIIPIQLTKLLLKKGKKKQETDDSRRREVGITMDQNGLIHKLHEGARGDRKC